MSLHGTDRQATRLRTVRQELGWTQTKVIAALTTQARLTGVTIAESASLKTMLSRWENGAGQPDHVYRRLFCLVYDRDEDDLGFTEQAPGLIRTPRIAPILDADTVGYFRDVFTQHLRADNLMGPHHLVEPVRAQAVLLDQVLPNASAGVRDELTRLACLYNEFTGWLYQDAGDPTSALFFTDRAMDYAMAYANPTDVAYMLMRKANISNDQASTGRALGLTSVGLRDATQVAPRVRALIYTQKARAHALTGDIDECCRAIDAAHREITRPEAGSDDLALYCTPAYVEMEAAACWTQVGKPDQAIPIFGQALTSWPPNMRRDLGLCQARLAFALAKADEITEACEVGAQAVATATTATSVRTIRDLHRLRDALAPWRRDAGVSKLTRQIKELTGTA